MVYSLESGEYERITDSGSFPYWLNDSRGLLFRQGPRDLWLVDTQTRRSKRVFRLDGGDTIGGATGSLAISKDNKTIYFVRRHFESDIYLLTQDR